MIFFIFKTLVTMAFVLLLASSTKAQLIDVVINLFFFLFFGAAFLLLGFGMTIWFWIWFI